MPDKQNSARVSSPCKHDIPATDHDIDQIEVGKPGTAPSPQRPITVILPDEPPEITAAVAQTLLKFLIEHAERSSDSTAKAARTATADTGLHTDSASDENPRRP